MPRHGRVQLEARHALHVARGRLAGPGHFDRFGILDDGIAIGIGTGLLCGAFNGFLVAGLKLPSIVVTIGTIRGGSAANQIPESIEMRGTMRTFKPAVRDPAIKAGVEMIV